MAKRKIIVGLDVGTTTVRTVVAERMSEEESVRIIGVGQSTSFGMRRGAVVDSEETSRAIAESVEAAEKVAGIMVDRAIVSIGGVGVSAKESKGVVAVGKADGEVMEDDLQRVITAAQAISIPLNKEIIHIIPRTYRLDEQGDIKDPIGMHGVRLEVDATVIEAPVAHIKNLTKALYGANIDPEDLILEVLAAAKAVLDKRQKELGVIVVTIGGSTTSLAVFEEGDLIHTAILPVGGGHITNDIAIGLRTSIDTAEKIKLAYGNATTDGIDRREEIDLANVDDHEEGVVLRYHIVEIIEARLEELFGMVQKELKAIGKAGLLPAGVVLTGGGAELPQIIDCAKECLGLPATIGSPVRLGGILDKVDQPSFATAVGLILWNAEQSATPSRRGAIGTRMIGNISDNMEDTIGRVRKWFEKFLP